MMITPLDGYTLFALCNSAALMAIRYLRYVIQLHGPSSLNQSGNCLDMHSCFVGKVLVSSREPLTRTRTLADVIQGAPNWYS